MNLKLQLVEFKTQIAIEVIDFNNDLFKKYLDKYFVITNGKVTILENNLELPSNLYYFITFTKTRNTNFGGRGMTLNLLQSVKMISKDSDDHYKRMTDSIKIIMNHIKTIEKLHEDMMSKLIHELF